MKIRRWLRYTKENAYSLVHVVSQNQVCVHFGGQMFISGQVFISRNVFISGHVFINRQVFISGHVFISGQVFLEVSQLFLRVHWMLTEREVLSLIV